MNVGRGVAAVVAVVVFLLCAPAWASTDAGHAPVMHRLALMMGHLPSSAVGRLSASARAGPDLRAATFTRLAKGHLKLTPTSLTYRGGHMKLGWSAANATVCTLSAKPLFWAGPNPARVNCRGKLTAPPPAPPL